MASGVRCAGALLLPGRCDGALTPDDSPQNPDDSPDETAPLMGARAPAPSRSTAGSGSDIELAPSDPSSPASASPVLPAAPAASSPIAASSTSSTSPAPETPPRVWPFGRVGDIFRRWREPRNLNTASNAADSGAPASHVRPAATSSPTPASSSTHRAPRTTSPLQMWPFGRVGDVFGTWRRLRPSRAQLVAPVTIFVVGGGAAPGQNAAVQIPINFTLRQKYIRGLKRVLDTHGRHGGPKKLIGDQVQVFLTSSTRPPRHFGPKDGKRSSTTRFGGWIRTAEKHRLVMDATVTYGLFFGRSSTSWKAYQVYFQMDPDSPSYLFGCGRNRRFTTETFSANGAASLYFGPMGRVSSGAQ